MSLSINNNITSLNAWRNLKTTDGSISKTMEKLSSGLRINRAADDPAGLVISEKMRAQLNGIDTAVKNSEKAINMVQTAEAALDKVGKLLVKIRQLAIDTANSGVNDTSMKTANQSELDEAIKSITRIADYSVFGTKKLLNGELGATVTAESTGLGAGATFDLSASVLQGQDSAAVNLTLSTLAQKGSTTLGIDTAATAGATTLVIDGQSFSIVSGGGAVTTTDVKTQLLANATLAEKYDITTGAAVGSLTLTNKTWGTSQSLATVSAAALSTAGAAAAVSTTAVGVDAVGSLKVGATVVGNLSTGSGLTLKDASGNAITITSTAMTAASTGTVVKVGVVDDNSATFQIGANENQTVTVSIQSTKATAIGRSATYGDTDAQVTTFMNLSELTSTGAKVVGGVFKGGTADQVAESIGVIDKAIDDIATMRGALGAAQSDNLQVQLDSLRVSYENLQASESTIRDADMTSEMATFTKYQVMMQAGVAMLAQANQQPNTLLSLLR